MLMADADDACHEIRRVRVAARGDQQRLENKQLDVPIRVAKRCFDFLDCTLLSIGLMRFLQLQSDSE
jgi:hypothetical protein